MCELLYGGNACSVPHLNVDAQESFDWILLFIFFNMLK